jgi:hypothetical protein
LLNSNGIKILLNKILFLNHWIITSLQPIANNKYQFNKFVALIIYHHLVMCAFIFIIKVSTQKGKDCLKLHPLLDYLVCFGWPFCEFTYDVRYYWSITHLYPKNIWPRFCLKCCKWTIFHKLQEFHQFQF